MDFSQYIRRIQARAKYSDYIAQEQRISQGCGDNSSYKFRPLDSGTRTDILIGEFNTSAAETSTILGSPIANCPSNAPPPPPPPFSPSSIAGLRVWIDATDPACYVLSGGSNVTSTIDKVYGTVSQTL